MNSRAIVGWIFVGPEVDAKPGDLLPHGEDALTFYASLLHALNEASFMDTSLACVSAPADGCDRDVWSFVARPGTEVRVLAIKDFSYELRKFVAWVSAQVLRALDDPDFRLVIAMKTVERWIDYNATQVELSSAVYDAKLLYRELQAADAEGPDDQMQWYIWLASRDATCEAATVLSCFDYASPVMGAREAAKSSLRAIWSAQYASHLALLQGTDVKVYHESVNRAVDMAKVAQDAVLEEMARAALRLDYSYAIGPKLMTCDDVY